MDKILFIVITTNCNLKCLGCMQSCDQEKNPYYISLNDLKEQLLILKKTQLLIHNDVLDTIHLTGGDPLTHPDFLQICELVHTILPNFKFSVSTNGLLLNKFSDEQLLKLYNDFKIFFQLSIYPTLPLLNMYQKIEERFKRLNIRFTFAGNSHFFFSKQEKITEKEQNFRDYNQQCREQLNQQDHVILYKNNIYSCWKDVNILQKPDYVPEKEINTLNIYNLKNKQELIQNYKHDLCNICKKLNGSGGFEYILWKNHYKYADIIFNNNLKDLYINYYNIYYDIQHSYNNYKEILSNNLFQKFLSTNESYYANTRYLNGQGDIFIPFSSLISPILKQFLELLPNNKQYNIYFISILNTPEIEEEVYKLFMPYANKNSLKTYFLKASSLYSAYTTFLQNSYLKNKFFIDFNNGKPFLKSLGVNNE